MSDSLRAQLTSRANVLKRYRSPDDPVLIDARREATVAGLKSEIERRLATAPPLRDEQLDQLAALLRPGRRTSDDEPGVHLTRDGGTA